MSYEKKMKDLMARLVSMSPVPPPYPDDETPMARHETAKSPRPALAFAAAAALVALLAVPLLLFTGGEEAPLAGSSTTTSTTEVLETTTTTTVGTTTTSTGDTTTSVQSRELAGVSGVVFLTQTPENSFLGNPALVPIELEVVARGVFDVDPDMLDAVAAVIDHGRELPAGLETSIPLDVQVVSLTAEDGVVVADMNEAFLDGAGGLLADVTMLNQLIYTLTFETSEQEVLFTVGGEPVEAFGSEGIVLTEPVGRDDFLDNAANIFLTQPIYEFEQIYAVNGLANTFEGALAVRVLDAAGNTVHEEPVQATCGSGCWGEFGVGIGSDLIVPGESAVQLFTYSAEDGSVTESIIVPIPEQGSFTE